MKKSQWGVLDEQVGGALERPALLLSLSLLALTYTQLLAGKIITYLPTRSLWRQVYLALSLSFSYYYYCYLVCVTPCRAKKAVRVRRRLLFEEKINRRTEVNCWGAGYIQGRAETTHPRNHYTVVKRFA